MIPPRQHPIWAKLIRGEVEFSFKSAAAGMLFSSLRRHYRHEPNKLSAQVEEAYRFFAKYETVMGPELALLVGRT